GRCCSLPSPRFGSGYAVTLPMNDTAIAADGPDTRTLAIFDLDGTLVTRDTFLPFLIRYALKRRRYWPLLVTPFWILLYLLRLISARTVKERLLTAYLKGERKDEVSQHASDFCSAWVERRVRPHVFAKLREHQQAGHRVILE